MRNHNIEYLNRWEMQRIQKKKLIELTELRVRDEIRIRNWVIS
jgi:hypothetical protein